MKKYALNAVFITGFYCLPAITTPTDDIIIIQPSTPLHFQSIQEIIINNSFQFQLIPSISEQDAKQQLLEQHELDDIINMPDCYFNNHGTFLVMLQESQVIGMGGLQYFSQGICELRRICFAQSHHGKGLGKRMVIMLIEQAKLLGYKKMRLWVYNPHTQGAAVALYKKLGFYDIAPYVACKGQLFMEKEL